MIISYQRVKNAMLVPPPEDLVDLFNYMGEKLSNHDHCIQDSNPFDKLFPSGGFCISATSIQKDYIAFVLGKHAQANFPTEIMSEFFDLGLEYTVQFGLVQGEDINGCIFLIHYDDEEFDLKDVYAHIYSK